MSDDNARPFWGEEEEVLPAPGWQPTVHEPAHYPPRFSADLIRDRICPVDKNPLDDDYVCVFCGAGYAYRVAQPLEDLTLPSALDRQVQLTVDEYAPANVEVEA